MLWLRFYAPCAGVACPDTVCGTKMCDPGSGKCVAKAKLKGGVCSEPNVIADLAVWLDAGDVTAVLRSTTPNTSASNGQSVVKWLDMSGHSVDLAPVDGYAGPVLTTHVANGRPVARFTGTGRFTGQMRTVSQAIGSGALTLIAVYARREAVA